MLIKVSGESAVQLSPPPSQLKNLSTTAEAAWSRWGVQFCKQGAGERRRTAHEGHGGKAHLDGHHDRNELALEAVAVRPDLLDVAVLLEDGLHLLHRDVLACAPPLSIDFMLASVLVFMHCPQSLRLGQEGACRMCRRNPLMATCRPASEQ